ncbi:MAG: hypothetical protein U1F57_06970 [bacterium]
MSPPVHLLSPGFLADLPPSSPVLLAQVTPPVSSGSSASLNPTPAPTSPPPNTPVRLTWPDLVAMRRDWDRIFTDAASGTTRSFEQHVLGANYSRWQEGRFNTYSNVSVSLLRIRYFLEGSQCDTLSIRGSVLDWLRAAQGSRDPVLRNTIVSVIDTLQQFQEPHYRERALQILSVIEETRRITRPVNPGGSYVPAAYFAESLRQRNLDPSWFIPAETLASPEALNAAMIYQGEAEDGVIQIPILRQTAQGPVTLGWREVDVTGRILDSYAPTGTAKGRIESHSLPAQSARVLIAAALGLEELPSSQRNLNLSERRLGSLLRSGWMNAELTHLDEELTRLKERIAVLKIQPSTEELDRATARVAAIQVRVEQINRLIPAS